jgi:hypothetical protein
VYVYSPTYSSLCPDESSFGYGIAAMLPALRESHSARSKLMIPRLLARIADLLRIEHRYGYPGEVIFF